jgi:glutaredoxin
MNSKPILATSQFCGPCKLLKSQLDPNSYEVRDMMEDRDFFVENGIRSVPMLIIGSVKITGTDQILGYFRENP